MDEAQHSRVETVAEELASLSNEELEQLGDVISRQNPSVIQRLQGGARQRKGSHSIMELEGIGADIWRSIDVDAYLKQERDSWR